MIKHVACDRGIKALLSNRSYISQNSLSGSGMVRYNTSNQSLEAFDGYSWINVDGVVLQIGLDTEAQYIMDWAKKKMEQERRIEEYAQRFQSVKFAKEELDTVQEKMEVLLALVSDPK